MDEETEIKALQALRKTATTTASRAISDASDQVDPIEAAARLAAQEKNPPAAKFGSIIGASRAELAAEKRRLIAAAAADGASETDDSIMQRHQEAGGSGVVKKVEGDYQKKKYKFFRDKLAAAGELMPQPPPPVSTTSNSSSAKMAPPAPVPRKRRGRWDATPVIPGDISTASAASSTSSSMDVSASATVVGSDQKNVVASRSRWDATPLISAPGGAPTKRKRWDATPVIGAATGVGAMGPPMGANPGEGVGGPRKRSRWDETPMAPVSGGITSLGLGANNSAMASASSLLAPTPIIGTATSTISSLGPVPVLGSERDIAAKNKIAMAQLQQQRDEQDVIARNQPLTDEDLDAMLPSEGYRIVVPPPDYQPVRSSRALLAAPGEGVGESGEADGSSSAVPSGEFSIQSGPGGLGARANASLVAESGRAADGDLPFIKPEDMEFFGRLVEDAERRKEGENESEGSGVSSGSQSVEEKRDLEIMKLLLKIKNGLPKERKVAMRSITDRAPEFGPAPLFNQVLPILMSPSLEDQERHLLVKVIDRILFKLEDRIRPFCHKILMVIVPMLVDENNFARVEGRDIVASLAKAAGLATMIQTMKDDLSNPDDYVRNVTARAFAVVASALGIPALLPFLDAVCRSKKSWEARHTGIKIIRQIAILIGSAVLPHLAPMVDMIEHGLNDINTKVSMITAQAVSALAKAAHPYGIECFGGVLKPLFEGVRLLSNKRLAAYLKAVGYIIPLMDHDSADAFSSGACTRLIMPILIREFSSPDDDMKRVVLNVLTQCVNTEGVEASYVRNDILPDFFKRFWVRRMALDRRNYRTLVDTTVSLADKVGSSVTMTLVVPHLMDESEPFRKMVVECIDIVLTNLGAAEIDNRLVERLVDGILYAFQEDNAVLEGGGKKAATVLNGFGTVVNTLGTRVKPYLAKICGTIKWRLHNKSAAVRMQAADLASRIALVVMQCGEEDLLNHLGVILFEYLGEEFPEVLGSILGALRSIVNVVGMEDITPPIRDLLPRLTPVLKNRHEKVQENCIDLIGRIADRAAAQVSAREWMRICFELLELLKASRKSIRRAAVSTFGFIAKAIGPQDVLHTLLNNLKVQDRQNRVCTTVAIAIVAETCSPFTVLPALMNEYRVPDVNVQNGVLKALSFVFEYIGPMARDYIYAITPLITNALQDRDLVHRQTASAATKHIALGVQGLGCEDAVLHLLNHVWPNIFEQSPHVIKAVFGAIESCRVCLGVHVILAYVLQGLFHPARRVRDVYWRIYNNLYVYGADQLTPAYPDLPQDDIATQSYRRTHLDLFV